MEECLITSTGVSAPECRDLCRFCSRHCHQSPTQVLPVDHPISQPLSLFHLRKLRPVLVLDSPRRRRNWFKAKPDEIKSDVRKDLPRWWKPAWGELSREGGLASWGRGTWVKSVTCQPTSPASGIWMGIWSPSALGHCVP